MVNRVDIFRVDEHLLKRVIKAGNDKKNIGILKVRHEVCYTIDRSYFKKFALPMHISVQCE